MNVGLELDKSKTNLFPTPQDPLPYIHINGDNWEHVPHFKYLDSAIRPNGQARDNVKLHVDCTRRAFVSLSEALWSRGQINLCAKLRI